MKTLISTMKPYDDDDSTGRIFSVKFNPENSNNYMKIYLKYITYCRSKFNTNKKRFRKNISRT